VEQEAEWNNGPTDCPNLYANIVLTLPANATYYTYQLRIMFIFNPSALNHRPVPHPAYNHFTLRADTN
jgi:hypothetical protein